MNGEPLLAQYVPGTGLLHRLDARSKSVAVALLTADVLHASWPLEVCGLALLAVLGIRLAGIGARQVWRSLRPLFFLVAFSALMNLLSVPGDPAWRLGPLTVTRAGLLTALETLTRIPVLILTASILVWTTPPGALIDGMTAAARPLARLGRAGTALQDLALFAGLALRFLPMVHESFHRVRIARLARGIDLEGGPAWVRWRNLAELIIPWLIDVFRRADAVAIGLAARGYRRGTVRTPWQIRRWSAADYLLVGIGLLVTLWVWRRELFPAPPL
ncbi:MAG: energy-coupling factor transporter transmembrane protein EcfT [Alicyclobacillaceae bacterium]|nr:energy-coupling factor transporter transmembrane protein EcfT [Alicyclobacillaceae bacterium]